MDILISIFIMVLQVVLVFGITYIVVVEGLNTLARILLKND